MIKNYIFIFFLGIISIAAIIIAFTIIGNPLEQQAETADNKKLADFTTLRYRIENYYSINKKLPESLLEVVSKNPTVDSQNDVTENKDYQYKILTANSFELCTNFATDTSNVNQSNNIIIPNGNVKPTHKKGFNCIKYQFPQLVQKVNQESTQSGNRGTLLNEGTQTTEKIHNFIENGSFEAWPFSSFPDQWSLDLGNQLNRAFVAYDGSNAIQFVAKLPKSSIKYEKIGVQPYKKYELSFYYKTQSNCQDCAFIGFQIFDSGGGEIINDVSNCGEYNSEVRMWYRYINGKASTYTHQTSDCVMPGKAATVKVKVGIWNPPDTEWEFDKFELN